MCSNVIGQTQKVIKQGHRGARGLMPENTIAAMKTGLDMGSEVLELDVVISKDKQVVVSHDSYMLSEISLKADRRFYCGTNEYLPEILC